VTRGRKARYIPAMTLRLAASILALVSLGGAASCIDNPPPVVKTPTTGDDPQGSENSKPVDVKLVSEDVVVGNGTEAKKGDAVTVDYTGTLLDGTKFDSSKDRKNPFSFIIGNGQVIRGWEQGVVGMKVGGRRKLTIPPELAYGHEGKPPTIPADATLVFDIELLHVVQ
jgi:peptidylprolyl isomerase/FKBP-type peptidyl-prolyl cis-trans isomerase FkpA